ncbi:MAG: sulfotransferase family protein [Candidatus Binatia bacterium]
MGLRVIGAGLPRTGTMSLKTALERLLGAPCYHMVEVFAHPEHIPTWHAAVRGQMPDWGEFLRGYAAAVDAPASLFWSELSAAFPDAVVVLSVRDPETWWNSASQTVFRDHPGAPPEWRAMIEDLDAARFTHNVRDHDAAIAAYERHNERVRRTAPAGRLLEWRAEEGWKPICRALDVPVPDEPFPHTNTRAEWRAREPPE